jgi:hypothetical protein
MDHPDQTDPTRPAPPAEMTLMRFCRWRRLPLDHDQRSRIGIELSRICRQRQITTRKVKEKCENGGWSKNRLYPVALLEEWRAQYRKSQPQEPKTPDPVAAANG